MSDEQQNPLSVLRAARRYIETGWCKDWLARTADGKPRGSTEPDATQWCAIGALGAAVGFWHPSGCSVGDRCLFALATQLPDVEGNDWRKIATFNNYSDTTRDDVLALYDRAIDANHGYAFAAFRARTLR